MTADPVDWTLFWLASIASGLSIWLAARSSGIGRLPGCGIGSGCATLAATRWSRWTEIPVAVLGAGVYALLAIISLASLPHIARASSPVVRECVASLSMAIAASVVWFVALQLLVVRRACIYCNLVHLLGLSIFWIVFFSSGGEKLREWHEPMRWMSIPALFALFGVVALVAGQLFWRPKMYAVLRTNPSQHAVAAVSTSQSPVVSLEHSDTNINSATVALPRNAPSLSRSSREVTLISGKVILNTADCPLIGSAQALHLVALLFDYTCPTCRTMHQIVGELVERKPDWIGVLLLPLPQSPTCNPNVTEIYSGRGQACQFARLATAVWKENPDRFEHFERFLLSNAELPPLGTAMAEAAKLIGGPINPHQPDDQLDGLVCRSIEVFRAAGLKKIPSLLLPDAVIAGEFQSVNELRNVLQKALSPQHLA
jgi:uncharacterized membrane protein